MKGFRRRITDSSSGPATYIAPDAVIDGSLKGKGASVFCGRMQGDSDIEGPLTLAEGGHWTGTLKATDVIVAGTVEGDVVAANRIEIAGTARISGSLSGLSIAVAEGAVIQGKITVTSGAGPTTFEEKRSEGNQKLAAG
jgi:cytoskeletal protein CcmA (bactofilin family)